MHPSRVWCLVIAMGWSVIAAAADDGYRLNAGALAFGDAYYVPGFHTDDDDDAAGLVMRRAYLTFDADLGMHGFGRLRFEANQAGEFETYDVETKIKDLYLGRDLGAQKLIVGLSPTPTFDVIESWWGARYLARTPMDLQGVASRDTGVTLSGPLAGNGKLSYRAMVAPAADFESDGNDAPRYMAALNWRPDGHWMVDFYADYEDRPGSTDRRTWQGFVGFATDAWRWGLQYSNQDRDEDPDLELASSFVVVPLSSRSSVILRVDHLFEPSPNGDGIAYLPFDPSATATMLIAGLEFRHGTHFRVTPNVVFKHYGTDDSGQRPDSDVHLRLTVFVDFE